MVFSGVLFLAEVSYLYSRSQELCFVLGVYNRLSKSFPRMVEHLLLALVRHAVTT